MKLKTGGEYCDDDADEDADAFSDMLSVPYWLRWNRRVSDTLRGHSADLSIPPIHPGHRAQGHRRVVCTYNKLHHTVDWGLQTLVFFFTTVDFSRLVTDS